MLIYLRRLQGIASWLVISIGLVTLIGWAAELTWLTAGLLTLTLPKATTAVGLLLAGVALALWGESPSPRRRHLAQATGGIATVVGLLTLLEYLFNWPLDLNRHLAVEPSIANLISDTERMSINSALCLLLTGTALITLEIRLGRQYLAEWLAIGASFVLLTVYIGYIYELENSFYHVGFTGMGGHTVVAFSLLCIGILVARPQRGIMAHFWSDAPAGVVARSMSFGGITLLLLLSWLTEQGWRRSLYGERYQVALLLSLGALVFGLLVHRSIRALVRLDHERQQGVAELQASETRFRQLIEQAADGIFIADRQGRYRRVNASGAAMLGYTPDALSGKAIADLIPATDQPRLAAVYQELLQPGQRHFGEWQLQRKDGTYLPVEINTQILPDGRWLTIVRDISERKTIEAQLATHARQQAVIAALGQEALREEDLQRFMDSVIRAVADTLAVDFCKLSELLPEHKQLLLRAGWGWRPGLVGMVRFGTEIESQSGYTLLTSEPVIVTNLQNETRFTASDILTEHHVVSGISCIIGDPHDHPFGVLSVHTLVERHFIADEVNFLQTVANLVAHAVQRKEAEIALRQLNATLEERVAERTAELERSNHELDQFAYVASHDLKAPLRAIDNLASWLDEDVGDTLPATSREHLSKLRLRVQRMEHLLEDLLTYSRVGRRDRAQEEINVNDLLQNIVDLLAPPPGFTVTVAPAIPLVHTPRAPLELIFRNLISNAIKHHDNPAQGRIEIQFHDCADCLTFVISDNGPGIESRFHERIFGMFQTLRPRDDIEGSGMGLAVVKKAVEHWGGTISVASVPGQGATFTFTWPKDLSH
jgi:PAS domain S-box-containing protein